MSDNRRLLSGVLFCCAAALTGCGMGTITTSGGGGTLSLQGMVHGGQQGVSGSTIQLYTVGSTGNGSAATPMLTGTVTTDSNGLFSITNAYTCGKNSSGSAIASSNQVYLVASGGNPGLTSSDNPALVMMAALGPCSNLSSTSYIFVNEVTTVAAAWALAPFTASATNIGASSTNALGIENAFLDAGLLANTTTGAPATLPSNLTIETGKLNALADALASCINSDGTTACAPLFTAATAGSSVPTNTFTAALNIVKNPGQNVAAVFGAIGGTSVPFATTLTQSPNDWTMSLTVTGGGLFIPKALGIDSQGNVWVANYFGPLSAFNPQGTPLSATGFGLTNGAEITQVNDLVIDPLDNIWVTNQQGFQGGGTGSVTEFYGVSSGQIGVSPQSAGYTDSSLQYPYALAADTNGDIFIANTGDASATVYNSTGGLLYPDLGATYGLAVIPEGIAVDASHGFWLPGGNVVAHVAASSIPYPNGQLLSDSICCQLSYGVATDKFGNLWVADNLGGPPAPNNEGAFADIASDGSILLSAVVTGGINHPEMVAVDAAQNAWFANFGGASITEIAGNGGTISAGTALSPSSGVYGTGGFGLDASLDSPFSIAPDRSGNLWICNQGTYAVTMFFGLAAPTVTPLQPVPTAP